MDIAGAEKVEMNMGATKEDAGLPEFTWIEAGTSANVGIPGVALLNTGTPPMLGLLVEILPWPVQPPKLSAPFARWLLKPRVKAKTRNRWCSLRPQWSWHSTRWMSTFRH